MGPRSYFEALMSAPYEIEVMESFEKQTFRNRCLIHDAQGRKIRLTVPVRKVEHKQLTRDVEISYQSHWQHQHWIALESAYRHTPYFMYFADYLRVHYEKEYKWLVDLNDALTETIAALLRRERPIVETLCIASLQADKRTTDWSGEVWTDRHRWQKEESILDTLFEDLKI